MPRPDSAVLGWDHFVPSYFLRGRGSRMRVRDLSSARGGGCSSLVFLVSSSLPVMAASAARQFPLPPTLPSEQLFAAPLGITHSTASPTSPAQGTDSALIIDPAASTPSLPGPPTPPTPSGITVSLPPWGRTSTWTCQRLVARTGAAQPAVDYVFELGGVSRSSARRAGTPPRVPRPRSPLAVAEDPPRAVTPAPTLFTEPSFWGPRSYDSLDAATLW